jgi:photosystem II stability/assembly factor-like uncharacterized protein
LDGAIENGSFFSSQDKGSCTYLLDGAIENGSFFSSQDKGSCTFENKNGKKSRKAVELETREEVARAQVMKTDKGNKQQKKER